MSLNPELEVNIGQIVRDILELFPDGRPPQDKMVEVLKIVTQLKTLAGVIGGITQCVGPVIESARKGNPEPADLLFDMLTGITFDVPKRKEPQNANH